MTQIKANFVLDRETKGAVRYQEVDDKGQPETVYHKIGTVYLRKTAFDKGVSAPRQITVTIEAQS